jgi:hypothetical protein
LKCFIAFLDQNWISQSIKQKGSQMCDIFSPNCLSDPASFLIFFRGTIFQVSISPSENTAVISEKLDRTEQPIVCCDFFASQFQEMFLGNTFQTLLLEKLNLLRQCWLFAADLGWSLK